MPIGAARGKFTEFIVSTSKKIIHPPELVEE